VTFSEAVKQKTRSIYRQLIYLDDTPAKIAGGAAIGAFLGVFPTPFIAVILAIALAALFKLNRAAAAIGTVVMNPLTAVFFWTLSCVIGAAILGGDWRLIRHEVADGRIFRGLGHGLVVYLAGNIILSLAVAGLVYLVVLAIVKKHGRQKR